MSISSTQYVIVDIETKDLGIGRGEGSHWPLGTVEYLVGATYSPLHSLKVWKNSRDLVDYLHTIPVWVGHNISYDVGVLSQFGLKPRSHILEDTMLMAKLHDNTRLSYGLNDLGKDLLNDSKSNEPLGDAAKALGFVKSKAQNPVKVAMSHLDEIYKAQPELVIQYVEQDVMLTNQLYQLFNSEAMDGYDKVFYSDLIKALLGSRKKGVRVDVARARTVRNKILEKEVPIREWLDKEFPGLNVNSAQQMAVALKSLGANIPETDKGNPSVTKAVLETLDIELAKKVILMRRCEKLRRDFVDPIIEKFPTASYGYIYPEIKIFGAAATGRASAANPNIQQIPKRDKEFGPLIRSLYVAHEGETLYSLDFSAQEPRIQVHYAARIGCPGAKELLEAYNQNPRLDLHGLVAELADITRDEAKIINLGVAYGMGNNKLADSLKTTLAGAAKIKGKLASAMPYLMALDKACKHSIKTKGFIRTVLGRVLRNERGFESKALNKLVQGSAADQTWAAIVEAYRQGLLITFPVHDELVASFKYSEDAVKLQNIMQTAVPLLVPSITDIMYGPDWGSMSQLQV